MRFEVILSCEDGEHRTQLPFSPFSFRENSVLLVCDTCKKPFQLLFYTGIPFWEEEGSHPKPLSILIREIYSPL